MKRFEADDDDLFEPGTRVVRDKRKVVVPLNLMDHNSLDAVMRREFADTRRFNDTTLNKPGWRTASVLADATSMARTIAAPRIAAAYRDYDELIETAYLNVKPTRSENERLAEAKQTASVAMPMQGRSNPDDPLYKKFRAAQSSNPFQHPEGDDDDDNYQAAAAACPMCNGTGRVPPDNDVGAEADRIVRSETQTHTEGTPRLDVPDSLNALRRRHADQMQKIYDDEAETLSNAWRK